MKEVTLKGSFYEMGRQYGSSFKKEIKSFCFMARMMAAIGEGEGRDFFRPKWYHAPGAFFQLRKYHKKYKIIAQKFEKNIEKYYPEILEMMHGMADSTKIDYKDILFMNCTAEYSLKCSTMGAAGSSTENGHPILAMNADESKFVQKYEIILNIQPENGYNFKAVYMAGCVFPNFGMNEHGLSIISELLFLDNSGIKNLRLPIFMKFSLLHKCRNIKETETVLEKIPPSGIGTVVYVADSHRILVQEENALEKTVKILENGYYLNCNLPQSEELKKYDDRENKNDIVFFFAVDRERRLSNLFKKHDGAINEDLLYFFISDHGSKEDDTENKTICVHPENTKGIKTCASFIASPAEKSLRFYEGNPCENKVLTFKFD